MKQDLTDITILLDRSGSMSYVRGDIIGGINSFIGSQKGLPGSATVSLFQFDDQYESVYEGVPVEDVARMEQKDFVPRGWTALRDAIGRTINATGARLEALPEWERPAKVMLTIITDGLENRSKEFTSPQIAEMIEHQRTKYDWQIAFIGSNQDAAVTGGTMFISRDSTLSYRSTGAGVKKMSDTLIKSTTNYRGGGTDATLSFVED